MTAPDPNIQNWFGGLVDGMRDASGQMYMRHRYYDPQTGQFTQTDPIGLAGGLNAYGFAAGDPVSYSDPYGLCPHASDPARRSSDLSTCTKEDWERIRGGVDEPILLDPIVVVGVARGEFALLRAGWNGLRGLVGRIFGRGSATGAAGQFTSKAAARGFVSGLGLADAQATAVNRAIGRATSTSTIGISRGEGGAVIVSISRPGWDGHQVIESTIRSDGTKTVVQKAYDAAGKLVHNDPK